MRSSALVTQTDTRYKLETRSREAENLRHAAAAASMEVRAPVVSGLPSLRMLRRSACIIHRTMPEVYLAAPPGAPHRLLSLATCSENTPKIQLYAAAAADADAVFAAGGYACGRCGGSVAPA